MTVVKTHIADNIRKGWRGYSLTQTIGKPTETKLKYIYHRLGKDIIVDEENNILFIKKRKD